VFQAKPFEGAITCLTLGGNTAKRDKVHIFPFSIQLCFYFDEKPRFLLRMVKVSEE
jgi:hypothetical protein